MSINLNATPTVHHNKTQGSLSKGHLSAPLQALRSTQQGVQNAQKGAAKALFSQISRHQSANMLRSSRFAAALSRFNSQAAKILSSNSKDKIKEKLKEMLSEGDDDGESLTDSEIHLVLKTIKQGQGETSYNQLGEELQEAIDELSEELYAENKDEIDAKDVLSFIESTEDKQHKKKKRSALWDMEEELTEEEILLLLKIISLDDFMRFVRAESLSFSSLPVYQRIMTYSALKKDEYSDTFRMQQTHPQELSSAFAHKTMLLSSISWLLERIKKYNSNSKTYKKFSDQNKKEINQEITFLVHDLSTQHMIQSKIQEKVQQIILKYTDYQNENISPSQRKLNQKMILMMIKLIRIIMGDYVGESPNKTSNIQRLDAIVIAANSNDEITQPQLYNLV